jgi:glycyl-tRNA synthetase (class II)
MFISNYWCDTMTLRDRDTMQQTRMKIGEILAFLDEKVNG